MRAGHIQLGAGSAQDAANRRRPTFRLRRALDDRRAGRRALSSQQPQNVGGKAIGRLARSPAPAVSIIACCLTHIGREAQK